MALKILTANRLNDGVVVWFGKDYSWHEQFDKAFIAHDDVTLQILQQAQSDAFEKNLVVDVNIIDVDENGPIKTPKRLRERIRQNGPTIAYTPNI